MSQWLGKGTSISLVGDGFVSAVPRQDFQLAPEEREHLCQDVWAFAFIFKPAMVRIQEMSED